MFRVGQSTTSKKNSSYAKFIIRYAHMLTIQSHRSI